MAAPTDCCHSEFLGAVRVYANAMLRDFDDERRLTEVQRPLTSTLETESSRIANGRIGRLCIAADYGKPTR